MHVMIAQCCSKMAVARTLVINVKFHMSVGSLIHLKSVPTWELPYIINIYKLLQPIL